EDRQAAPDDHEPALIARVNAEGGAAGAGDLGILVSCPPRARGRERLVDGDVDTRDATVIHANEGKQVPAVVDDRDIHVDPDLAGLCLRPLDDDPRVRKRESRCQDHSVPSTMRSARFYKTFAAPWYKTSVELRLVEPGEKIC